MHAVQCNINSPSNSEQPLPTTACQPTIQPTKQTGQYTISMCHFTLGKYKWQSWSRPAKEEWRIEAMTERRRWRRTRGKQENEHGKREWIPLVHASALSLWHMLLWPIQCSMVQWQILNECAFRLFTFCSSHPPPPPPPPLPLFRIHIYPTVSLVEMLVNAYSILAAEVVNLQPYRLRQNLSVDDNRKKNNII